MRPSWGVGIRLSLCGSVRFGIDTYGRPKKDHGEKVWVGSNGSPLVLVPEETRFFPEKSVDDGAACVSKTMIVASRLMEKLGRVLLAPRVRSGREEAVEVTEVGVRHDALHGLCGRGFACGRILSDRRAKRSAKCSVLLEWTTPKFTVMRLLGY